MSKPAVSCPSLSQGGLGQANVAVKALAAAFSVFLANFRKTFQRVLCPALIDSYQCINAGDDLFGIDLIFLDELDIETQ